MILHPKVVIWADWVVGGMVWMCFQWRKCLRSYIFLRTYCYVWIFHLLVLHVKHVPGSSPKLPSASSEWKKALHCYQYCAITRLHVMPWRKKQILSKIFNCRLSCEKKRWKKNWWGHRDVLNIGSSSLGRNGGWFCQHFTSAEAYGARHICLS